MEFILSLLFIYISVYTAYFLVLAFRNLNDRKFRIQQKYNSFNYKNDFCVVVYSHNNEATVENLIKQLSEQDYPKENYQVYVILDNCSDNSEKNLSSDSSINLITIKDQDTIGKDQAISILLEKLSAVQNYNAYVFLDGSRYIEKDFLHCANSALMDSDVISGSTILLSEKPNFIQKIKLAFHKYYSNFILKSRSLSGLAGIIDSDVLIMRQDLMEKIGCIDFQNIDTELKYSLLLSRIGHKCSYNPNIKTYVNESDFSLRLPSLGARFSLFKNCIAQIWTNNFSFNEHVLSLLAPNMILVVFAYLYIMAHSFNYYFFVDFYFVLFAFISFVVAFSVSLLNSKLKKTEFLYLFLYPIYSLVNVIKNLPICKKIKHKITGKTIETSNTEKLSVDVSVSDGKNSIACKLELMSINGLAKVTIIFKKKRFTTSTHLRMVDAIKELTDKLSDYGFILKICQCCKHFSPNIDGSTNMVKGFCDFEFSSAHQNGQIPTLLWNSCKGFSHNKVSSIIEEISQ